MSIEAEAADRSIALAIGSTVFFLKLAAAGAKAVKAFSKMLESIAKQESVTKGKDSFGQVIREEKGVCAYSLPTEQLELYETKASESGLLYHPEKMAGAESIIICPGNRAGLTELLCSVNHINTKFLASAESQGHEPLRLQGQPTGRETQGITMAGNAGRISVRKQLWEIQAQMSAKEANALTRQKQQKPQMIDVEAKEIGP